MPPVVLQRRHVSFSSLFLRFFPSIPNDENSPTFLTNWSAIPRYSRVPFVSQLRPPDFILLQKKCCNLYNFSSVISQLKAFAGFPSIKENRVPVPKVRCRTVYRSSALILIASLTHPIPFCTIIERTRILCEILEAMN